MVACSACLASNPDGARFCNSCGARLDAPQPDPPARRREERKVVTSLFCDLVGFTSTSEHADPEDVQRMLDAYFAVARREIEAHGGSVSKFIGDAVLGVFGVPVALGDDAERAVRAGLRIAEEAAGLRGVGGGAVRLRVGINTGEALVQLGVDTQSGEHYLTGDSVNTASRIQSAAPEMGVAVGESTWLATRHVIVYEEQDRVALKGKAEPVRIFRVTGVRPDATPEGSGGEVPFVGRDDSLAAVLAAWAEVREDGAGRAVLVAGEPGIGKSRLVREARRRLVDGPAGASWHTGRCVPYGQRSTFAALGQVVRAEAGLRDTDDEAETMARLAAVVPDDDRREWPLDSLRPLVGLPVLGSAEREDLFNAWAIWLAHVASGGPLVVVIEDLHWADEALLDFLEQLAPTLPEVPLLLVLTTRPDLEERRPALADALGAARLDLRALAPAAVTTLLAELLGGDPSDALAAEITAQADGNPLHALELARLVGEQGLVVERDGRVELRPGAALPRATTVEGLLAARIDALPPADKALLLDASVSGRSFWPGALSAITGSGPEPIEAALERLHGRVMVLPLEASTVAEEREWIFSHVLVRDVAYRALPRRERATRHAAFARWLEATVAGGLDDRTDALAHHTATALELARAVGDDVLAEDLEADAVRYLLRSAERSTHLDAVATEATVRRALALMPADHPRRAEALRTLAETLTSQGDLDAAEAAAVEAFEVAQAAGDRLGMAQALKEQGTVTNLRHWELGAAIHDQYLAIVEELPPSEELVRALTAVSTWRVLQGRVDESLELADRGLAIAREIGVSTAMVNDARGMARYMSGDPGGLDDMREALDAYGGLVTDSGIYNNLAVAVRNVEGPAPALAVIEEGIHRVRRRRRNSEAIFLSGTALPIRLSVGDLARAGASAKALADEARPLGYDTLLVEMDAVAVLVAAMTGDLGDVEPLLVELEAVSRPGSRPDFLAAGLGSVAVARAALGQREAVLALLEELAGTENLADSQELPFYLPHLVRAAVAVGEPGAAEAIAACVSPRFPAQDHALVTARAAIAEARGRMEDAIAGYRNAAERWATFGVPPEAALAQLGLARSLVVAGRGGEALAPLREAAAAFEAMGMRPALAEAQALILAVAPAQEA